MHSNKLKQNRIIEIVLWTILILSPIILLAVQSAINGRNLFLGVPEWSDELDYWREMFSFSGNGFSFGGSMYYGYDAKIGPMGAHSFSPIAAWGLFSWLFKLNIGTHAILWLNLLYMMVAWALFVLLVRPNIPKTFIALLLAFLYPLTILYLHSSMIEMVCMAGIIIYFSLLYKWDADSYNSNKLFVIILLVGIWCTMVRPTYVVILFPALWCKNKLKINRYTVITMLAYIITFAVFYKLYGLFCSDYPGWITSRLAEQVTLKDKLSFLKGNAKTNLRYYFRLHYTNLCQVGLRYFYLVVTFYMLVRSLCNKWIVKSNSAHVNNNSDEQTPRQNRFSINRLYLSLFIMMFGLWVMMIVLYDILEWRDFRTFAPICFGAILFTFMKESHKPSLGVLAAVYTCFLIMFGFSKFNFVAEKQYPECIDLSSYFEVLETTDENGNARTLVVDPNLNWCDISVMSSVPGKLGYQVIYEEDIIETWNDVDYIFMPYNSKPNSGKFLVEIPGYGNIFQMY